LNNSQLKKILFGFCCTLFLYQAEASITDKQMSIAMRMVGHQVLLNAGDSTSRVLAIQKDSTHYTINFESEFSFEPDNLIPVIDCIMEDADVKKGYIVEVVDQRTQKVVYNYEIGYSGRLKGIPCLARAQPLGRYSILIYLVRDLEEIAKRKALLTQEAINRDIDYKQRLILFSLLGLILVLIGLNYFFKKPEVKLEEHIVRIGDSRFDKLSMKLKTKNQITELSNKEAELFLLFSASANKPLSRDLILNKVWGDEGAYVGRTLDVYVSKLRKKIEQDSSLKIVNIRGVGYKLVLN